MARTVRERAIARLLAFVLAVFALCGAPVQAATPVIPLPVPCVVTLDPALNAQQALAAGDADCTGKATFVVGKANWSIYRGLDYRSFATDPLLFRQAFVRDGAQEVWVGYADGVLLRSPTAAVSARQPIGAADLTFALPTRDVPITSILVRLDEVQGTYASPHRASVETRSGYTATTRNFTMFWGLYFGLMGAMLLNNLLLFAVMRRRFQILHCAFTASILLFALSWSGAVLYLVPGLPLLDHIHLNHFTIALCFMAAPAFYMSFLEKEALPDWFRKMHIGLCMVPISAAVMQMIGPQQWWRWYETALFGSALLAMIFLGAAVVMALRRGSRAVRTLLVAWSMTYVMVTLCAINGLGIVKLNGAWFDLLPFVATGFETVVTASAIASRLITLRRERDLAVGREQALKQLSETDPLTGLANRRALLDRVIGERGPITLCLLDLDHFKAINDRLGHDQGDVVLRRVADSLIKAAPPGAIVARLGGEEFAIVSPSAARGDVAERARLMIALDSSVAGLPVSVSAGVASGPVPDEQAWTDLYVAADAALYRAKEAGRDRVIFAPAIAPRRRAA